MLTFLYVTDLHGWAKGYEEVLQAALDKNISTIINGGDMLVKGSHLISSQHLFIEEYLPSYFDALSAYGIHYYGMFGNDDCRSVLCYWQELLGNYSNAHDLTESWLNIGDEFIIRGCNYVPDHPFGLKDWSVLDTRDFVRPHQFTYPVISEQGTFKKIEDINLFFNNRPTFQELLDDLAEDAPSLDRAILVCHAPPAKTDLGMISDSTDVGSVALGKWIHKYQPLLTLHGHIHESHEVSGKHTAKLGRTTAHQPGQGVGGKLVYSIVTIDEDEVRIEHTQKNLYGT